MAFPIKKSRRIVIDQHPFRWMVKNDFYGIMLLVISEKHNAQKLFASFSHKINDKDACMYNNPFTIEPNLVRKTILFGISKGYSPTLKGNGLNLGDLSEILVLNEIDK